MIRASAASILLAFCAITAPAWSQANSVTESEPNNTPANANPAALGDSITGKLSGDDIDYFVVDIPAGTFLHIASTNLDVCFIDQDGRTLLACNDPYSYPSGVNFPFTTAGRYFVGMGVGEAVWGPYGITLKHESFGFGPGDPVRPLINLPGGFRPADQSPSAHIWDRAARMAAGLKGELYVSVWDPSQGERVLRMDPSGDTTTLASGLNLTGDMVVDAFGDLVVAQLGDSTGLWRISPSGARSRIQANVAFHRSYAPLAVGPDGDLWVSAGDSSITRLGPTGTPKLKVQMPGYIDAMSVSPSGEVYFAAHTTACPYGIHVLRGTTDECVFHDVAVSATLSKLAFDKDGVLLLGLGSFQLPPGSVRAWGEVDVLSPGAAPRPLAHVPGLGALTFLRDQQGHVTSRLFALEAPWASTLHRVVEINGAADRAVGAGFAVRFFHATLDSLPPATLSNAYNQTLHVTTDATSLTWTVEDGTLPPGMTLSTAGVLQGTATTTGSFSFTVRATSGVRSWFAPGMIRVLVDVSVAEVTQALLGGPMLDQAKIEFLDQLGNKNGMLDVGDLRAFLRSRGQLQSP